MSVLKFLEFISKKFNHSPDHIGLVLMEGARIHISAEVCYCLKSNDCQFVAFFVFHTTGAGTRALQILPHCCHRACVYISFSTGESINIDAHTL